MTSLIYPSKIPSQEWHPSTFPVLINLKEWESLEPVFNQLESKIQKLLAIQAFVFKIESIFQEIPDLQSFRISCNIKTYQFQLYDITHPEVDSQYGTPAYLCNKIEDHFSSLSKTMPHGFDFFIQNNFKMAKNNEDYLLSFSKDKGPYLGLGTFLEEIFQENSNISIKQFEEFKTAKELKQNLEINLPSSHKKEKSIKIRV